jgi:hypothetical protein
MEEYTFSIANLLHSLDNERVKFSICKTENLYNNKTYINRFLTYLCVDDKIRKVTFNGKFIVSNLETKPFQGKEPKYRIVFKLYNENVSHETDLNAANTLLALQKMRDLFNDLCNIPEISAHTMPKLVHEVDEEGVQKGDNQLYLRLWPNYKDIEGVKYLNHEVSILETRQESYPIDGDPNNCENKEVTFINHSLSKAACTIKRDDFKEYITYGSTVVCKVICNLFAMQGKKSGYLGLGICKKIGIKKNPDTIGITDEELLNMNE